MDVFRNVVVGVFFVSILPSICFAGKPQFRGRQMPAGNVSTADVEASLHDTLNAMLRGGNGVAAQRLANVEANLWPTFQALPKNDMGRLAPKAVRYAVHNYFAKKHGWLIQGLHPNTMQAEASEVHEVSILQDKAPALVEALLEARRSNHGLSLSDLVVMVTSLEGLIFDESVSLLHSSYNLNGESTADLIEEKELDNVLTSYLLIFGSGSISQGPGGMNVDKETHKALRQMAEQDAMTPMMLDFEHDAVRNYRFANRDLQNPFVPVKYSFQTASAIVEDLAHDYGRWQNAECSQMKQELMNLDPKGQGSIPLNVFYGEKDEGDYLFAESEDYLRSIGALDESRAKKPQVRIANYLYGPSNCIVTSSYYSVCCLNECEALMNELEGQIQAPTASPKQLVDLVSNLSSATVDAPRELSPSLSTKLDIIAERNAGSVPVHGRLFAQWMHLAFPNECPFPHNVKDTQALMTSHWSGRTAIASEKERQRHVEEANASTANSFLRTAEALEPFWTEDEVLPLLEDQPRPLLSKLGDAMRVGTHVATLLVLVRIIWTALRAAKLGLNPNFGAVKKAKVEESLPW